MKIAIIGYSGSGKSTLAKKLAHHYHIPKLHLDTLQFLPNWIERPQEELIQDLGAFLDNHDNWVIDGNYSFAHYERRMVEADHIVLLTFSPIHSLGRVIKRYLKHMGHTREDMAAGCPEKLDLEFILWVLYKGRSKRAKSRYQTLLNTYPDKVIILQNQRDINQFLDHLDTKIS